MSNSIKVPLHSTPLDESILLRALERYGIPHPPSTVGYEEVRWGDKESGSDKPYYAYILRDGSGYGFGDWRKHGGDAIYAFPSKSRSGKYSKEELRQIEADKRERFEKRKKEEEAKLLFSTQLATNIWNANALVPVDSEGHAYLASKKVQSFGLRLADINLLKKEVGFDIRKAYDRDFWQGEDSLLVVPLKDIDGTLQSLQFINSNGIKRFLKDGVGSGCIAIGTPPEEGGYILICEGYATGASLYEARGHYTICCMGTSGLTPVAKAVRAKYPEAKMIMCADNDSHKHKDDPSKINVGLEKAIKTAQAAGAYVLSPVFGEKSFDPSLKPPSDFNDLHCREGIDAVKKQVDECLQGIKDGTIQASVPEVETEAEDDGESDESEKPKKAKKIVSWYHSGDSLFGLTKGGESVLITDKYIEITALVRQTIGKETKTTVRIRIKDRNGDLLYAHIPFDVIGDERKTMEFLGKVGFLHESKAKKARIYEYLRNSPTKELPFIMRISKAGVQENMDYVRASFSAGSEIQYELCEKAVGGKPSAQLSESTKLFKTLPDIPLIKFVLYGALAGFFVRFSGIGINPMFNFHGNEGIGKSTLMKLGASVCEHPFDTVNEWRATANGMENLAESGNDMTVFLDDNKQLKDSDAGEVVYMLANRRGKVRATRSGGMAEVKTFYGCFISCGESRFHGKVANMTGGFKRRIVDIDADPEGKGRIIHTAPEGFDSSEAYAKYLEEAIEKNHTIAGYTCVEWFLKQFENVRNVDAKKDAMRQMVKEKIKECKKVLFEEFELHKADVAVQEIAGSFALVMVGALFGVESGIFPWSKDEVIKDVCAVFDNWLQGRGGLVIPRDSVLEKLKEWLNSNDKRFVHRNQVQRPDGSGYDYKPDTTSRESFLYSFGYKVSGEEKAVAGSGFIPKFTEHHILPSAFNEFCKFASVGLYEAKRELVKAEVLTLDKDGQPSKIPERVTHDKVRPRAYCIKFTISSEEQEEAV